MDDRLKLMTMPGELLLDARGSWSHDEEPVTHAGIADYLSKHLRWSEEHATFVVEVDGRAVAIRVADTAYFVTALDSATTPWLLTLNDGSSCELVGPVEARDSGELLCRVKSGRFLAKFKRNVHQQLQPFIERDSKSCETAAPGAERYVIRSNRGDIEIVRSNQ